MNFAAFILTHGRPHAVITLDTLRRGGYTGDIYLVVDDEDESVEAYRRNFDNVIVFDKRAAADAIDEGNNFDDRRTITHARNACFPIAKSLGLSHFVELDDDYYYFGLRDVTGARRATNLDAVFRAFVRFLEDTGALTVAMSQGGDHIGGFSGVRLKRKAMNSFVCSVDRPFQFVGSYNEDVNTYVTGNMTGQLFFTCTGVQLDQKDTQSQEGGISGAYLDWGTYVKSFHTVMFAPSSVRVGMMGTRYSRLHHVVDWNATAPKIVPVAFRKP